MPATRSVGTALLGLDADARGYRRAATQVVESSRRMQRGATSLVKDVRSLTTASRFARERLRALGRTVGTTARSMVSFRGVVGTLVGGGLIGALVKRTIEYGSGLSHLGRQLGTSTNFLVQLQFAMGQVDIQTGRTNKLMLEFSRRVAEAGTDVGELVAAADKLGRGTEVRRIASIQGFENQIRAVFELLRSVEDLNERTFLADAFFGGRGRELVRLATAEYELFARAARSNISLATEQAKALEDANSAIGRFGDQVKNIFTRFLADNVSTLTTGLEGLADVLPDIIKGFSDFAGSVGNLLGVTIVGQVNTAEERIVEFDRKLRELNQRREREVASGRQGPLGRFIDRLGEEVVQEKNRLHWMQKLQVWRRAGGRKLLGLRDFRQY